MESFAAVVEIVPDRDGAPPIALLRCAYRASAARPIALILSGIHPDAVDMCLDDEVKRHANVKGVRYLYWHNRATVERAIVEATLLIGETFAFTSLARKNGIAPIFPLRHSIALLAALQEQAALTVVGPKRSNALKWSASYEIDRAESARRR